MLCYSNVISRKPLAKNNNEVHTQTAKIRGLFVSARVCVCVCLSHHNEISLGIQTPFQIWPTVKVRNNLTFSPLRQTSPEYTNRHHTYCSTFYRMPYCIAHHFVTLFVEFIHTLSTSSARFLNTNCFQAEKKRYIPRQKKIKRKKMISR